MIKFFACFVAVCEIMILVAANSKMPNYFHPCHKRKDFNKCALESAKFAIPRLIHGDRKLGLPTFSPMQIDLIQVRGSGDFKVTLKNLKVYGLETAEPVTVNVDFDKRSAHIVSKVPKLSVVGDYSVQGHILIFALNGFGPANLTFTDGTYIYDFEWTTFEKRGKTFAKIINSAFDYKLSNVNYHFANLIPNDPQMSETINLVLNQNWEAVNDDLKESVQKTLLVIHNQIFDVVVSQIPITELFLD